jgi:hypothetical protein
MSIKKAQVVLVKVGQEPKAMEITWDTQDALGSLVPTRALVGGSVEILPYPIEARRGRVAIQVNDSGRLEKLPENRLGIFGDFVVFRVNNRGYKEHLTTLTDKEVKEIFADLELMRDWKPRQYTEEEVREMARKKYGDDIQIIIHKAGSC